MSPSATSNFCICFRVTFCSCALSPSVISVTSESLIIYVACVIFDSCTMFTSATSNSGDLSRVGTVSVSASTSVSSNSCDPCIFSSSLKSVS